MKNYSAVTLVLLLNVLMPAQWIRVEGVTSEFVNTSFFIGDFIYAGADSLFISSDKGSTWQAVGFPDYVPVNAVYKTGDTVFAGTFGKGVFINTGNSSEWMPLNEGLGAWTEQAVSFLRTGDTLFYASNGGGIYYRLLGSQSVWQSFNQGLPSLIGWTINALAKTGNNLITGSGYSGFYYIRHIGSAEWIGMAIDSSGRHALTPNAFWTSGEIVLAGTNAGIYKSTDSGITWDSVGIKALPLPVVAFTEYNNRIYAGYSRPQDFFIWYSDDEGNTWNSFDHQFAGLMNLYAYDNKLWAATTQGLWYYNLPVTGTDEEFVEMTFKLNQNYPNPFNPSTVISYSLKEKGIVQLKIFDILGREVSLLFYGEKEAGEHSITFNADGLAGGIYICSLVTEEYSASVKMNLIK